METMDNKYHLLRTHMMSRMGQPLRPLIKLSAFLFALLFILVQVYSLLDGKFHPFSLLLLLLPLVIYLILHFIISYRAVLNVQEKRQKIASGYFVNLTNYLENADDITIKALSALSILRTGRVKTAVDVAGQTGRNWYASANVFIFINADYFVASINEWRKKSVFDFVNELSIQDTLTFFVFDEKLTEQVRSLCSEQFTNSQFSFKISKKCFARYVVVKNVDDILLDAGIA